MCATSRNRNECEGLPQFSQETTLHLEEAVGVSVLQIEPWLMDENVVRSTRSLKWVFLALLSSLAGKNSAKAAQNSLKMVRPRGYPNVPHAGGLGGGFG